MNEDRPFEVQDTRIAYENPWIKVREDKILRKNGKEGIYGYLEVSESVCIVAVDEAGRICLVESYRHPFNAWFWELPGGGGEGEELISASKKELKEETGITATKWTKLGRGRVCNGLSSEWQTNVLAAELEFGDFVQTEDETRARKFITIEELDAMINNGDFADNQSITAIYMYKNYLDAISK
jgi:8-oxo-dGTP pyrophosphatase MutT (NUDIX family)